MSKKLTQEEFIQRATEQHDSKYSYNKVVYLNTSSKVKIVCPIHGEFEQTPNKHMAGRGCPSCGGTQRLSKSDFIERSADVHNNKYDYSLVEYTTNAIEVVITCKRHGSFKQKPSNHMNGQGCPKCSKSSKLNTETFIVKAKAVHEGRYIYIKTSYVKSRESVTITCNIHGDFKIIPAHHLQGQGCQACSQLRKQDSLQEFIGKAREVHLKKYDYSAFNYTNSKTASTITCPVHGNFEQRPSNHLSGYGCSQCGEIEKRKRYYNKPTTLYYIRVNNYYKIGITKNSIGKRFSTDLNVNIQEIKSWVFSTGKIAYKIEQYLLGITKQFEVPNCKLLKGGNSELRSKDVLLVIEEELNNIFN